jgi:hypothetical protein
VWSTVFPIAAVLMPAQHRRTYGAVYEMALASSFTVLPFVGSLLAGNPDAFRILALPGGLAVLVVPAIVYFLLPESPRWHLRSEPTSPEDVRVEKLVAEFALGVMGTGEVAKRRQFRIERQEVGRARVDDLSPMRPRAERQQHLFDLGCERRHRLDLAPPGKMDGDAVIPE